MSVTASVTTQIGISADAQSADSIGNNADYKINTSGDSKLNYGVTSPTSQNQVSTVPGNVHASRHTITLASLTLDIDLSALTNVYGACSFTKIYGIYVKNRDVTGGSGLKIGGNGPANYWQGLPSVEETLDAKGEFLKTSPVKGMNVTNTSKVLRFENDAASSGSVVFDLVVWGA